ncbi:hypothetical protein MNBD_ALPHA06-903 [hydrothermal vent metagenome]|uniref:Zinc finger DksA/TraR C4-type domain-containing protein n=1 Tax=hydrothermal vent metagenome TaxID=652676 RepID=A0A3B0R3T9_9ZZZZ
MCFAEQMKKSDAIRKQLLALRDELENLRQQAKEDRKPVQLDQQSVGRLSRMDSMQIQAMDNATNARRQLQIRRIDAALVRLNEDEYGFCVTCGEPIAPARLEQDPAVPFCIGCA